MQFELVTPAKKIASFEVEQAIIPGSEGMFGVLKGHQPVLSMLKPGLLRVIKADGSEEVFSVGNGFVDVTGKSVSVLAETASKYEGPQA